MTDIFTRPKRRRIMQAVRRQNTRPERDLAEALGGHAVSYIQHPTDLPGKPDFYFQDQRLAVFVHGCFWHGHPGCAKGRSRPKTRRVYWRRKIERNRRRDRRVAKRLRRLGLSVYTVWECELRHGRVPARLLTRLRWRRQAKETCEKPHLPSTTAGKRKSRRFRGA